MKTRITCSKPDCDEPRVSHCDCCDKPFCEDHGTVGGDRYVQDCGLFAYPSVCWACGGYDVDS
jgi:hypothetical protein